MTAAEAYGELLRIGRPIVTTGEAATRLKTSVSRASHLLSEAEEAGLTRRLRHGLWALHSEIDAFVVAPFLTAPFPAYVSFWSALAHHDMIEQIPRQISVASLDRARRITTAAGTYAIHHLNPKLFGGYRGSEATGYLATPEKALFDSVYVRAASGTQAFFPELSVPAGFDDTHLGQWTRRIASPRLQTLVSRRLHEVLEQASPDEPPSASSKTQALQEQPAEEVAQAEEDEDDDRDHGRDETHHL